ncbi:MAG: type 1 glutamine amidotransferase domain-containing protein [Gemmataceae bacterium]
MKALFLVADGFDDLHLFCPYNRLREEGIEVTLAGPSGAAVTGLHGYSIATDMPIREVNPAEYDLLVIPGGYSPEKLRLREEAVDVTRTFMDEDRRVAVVGHAAQLLISAGAMNGRRVTSAPEIRDDVRAAGGSYHDEAVMVDGNLTSCRGHEELADFCRAMMAGLALRA